MEELFQRFLSVLDNYQKYIFNEYDIFIFNVAILGVIIVSFSIMNKLAKYVSWKAIPSLTFIVVLCIGLPIERFVNAKIVERDELNSKLISNFENTLNNREIDELNCLIYKQKQKTKDFSNIEHRYLKSICSNEKRLIWENDDVFEYFNSEEFKLDLQSKHGN